MLIKTGMDFCSLVTDLWSCEEKNPVVQGKDVKYFI